MYYVYVLKSLNDGKFYTGFTEDLNKRLAGHYKGDAKSTNYRIVDRLSLFILRLAETGKMLLIERSILKLLMANDT